MKNAEENTPVLVYLVYYLSRYGSDNAEFYKKMELLCPADRESQVGRPSCEINYLNWLLDR